MMATRNRAARVRLTGIFLCLVLAANTTGAAAAGDRVAGRKKAIQCQACHGLDGLSKIPEGPNLAGQDENYLIKALNDYKTGARKNDMMSLVVPNLTDQDIADLAAYYAGIEVTVTPPK
ncbi:MAG TPA: cytochrome c [Xanthobacteraceae bacterium]|nr:cytochrome c [Xanthobacteraceae bacterium]